MDAFESLVSMLLRHEGYWTIPSYRVELTREEKVRIGKPSCPRWELDLIAYKASENKVLAVECKSYLDSTGVHFTNGQFRFPQRYKLFTEPGLWETVSHRLGEQLFANGMCPARPSIQLVFCAGHLANATNQDELKAHLSQQGHDLWAEKWVRDHLEDAATRGYENDVAFVVAKLLRKGRDGGE